MFVKTKHTGKFRKQATHFSILLLLNRRIYQAVWPYTHITISSPSPVISRLIIIPYRSLSVPSLSPYLHRESPLPRRTSRLFQVLRCIESSYADVTASWRLRLQEWDTGDTATRDSLSMHYPLGARFCAWIIRSLLAASTLPALPPFIAWPSLRHNRECSDDLPVQSRLCTSPTPSE